MAHWRKERDERGEGGRAAVAAAESEAGGEAARALDASLELQSARSDSGSSQRSGLEKGALRGGGAPAPSARLNSLQLSAGSGHDHSHRSAA